VFLPCSRRSGSGGGGRWVHGIGEVLFDAGVVLRDKWRAEEIEEAPFKEGGQR
jgi:hypothetical protein